MESAITSREIREYFMPGVPIEIPSEIVMVPKVCGIPPAAFTAFSALSARTFKPALQGVIVECALAMPTIGLSKSLSPKPTARNIERFGERASPSVIIELLLLLIKIS
jgi:hypothetical protein